MTDKLLSLIRKKYKLTELDAKEFAKLKVSGMKFDVKAYHAEGLGHVSVMKAKGFFGLMKMDTLVIVPQDIDLPLYSYDRILAMGNDTLIIELYDTFVEKADLSSVSEVNNKYASLPNRDPGTHWYDSIKLKESVSKKGKKKQALAFNEMTVEYLNAYLNAEAKKTSDINKKNELSNKYVDGLLENGGPSTDVFVKKLGKEKTARFFKEVLFKAE